MLYHSFMHLDSQIDAIFVFHTLLFTFTIHRKKGENIFSHILVYYKKWVWNSFVFVDFYAYKEWCECKGIFCVVIAG